MSQFVLCLFCLLVTHFKLACQSQHVDGSSGLKRSVFVKGATQISYGNFVADKFHRLQVSVGSSTTVMSYRECAMSCVNTPTCASFNVASSPDVDGKFRCELLNEDKYNSLNQLISSQEYHHFSIKTACSSYPCKNNGKCVPNYGDNQYHCDCVPGYEGSHCETDVDECSASSPVCDVNAHCRNTRGSYLCTCNSGYAGDGKTCQALYVAVNSSCANLLVTRSSTSGIIFSNRSESYSDYVKCQWNLSSNTNLSLVFFRFDTEVNYDFVSVYDGGSASSPLLGKFNGTTLPKSITSSHNKLFVTFTTDFSITKKGFAASYHVVDSVRLVNGSTPLTGRVEIFRDNQWGTICDVGWDINDANVTCRQLGFPNAAQAFGGARYGQGSGPIWMNNVACSGSEVRVKDCSHRGMENNNCTHRKDASIECSSRIP